jgi:hypothetical protein
MSKNQRLNATITIGSALEGSVKRNIGFLKSGLGQVGDAIKGVERRQRELDKQRRVLIRQGKSVEALDREYEDLTRTLGRLKRQQERWNRAAGASRRVGASFSSMTTEIGRNARRLTIGLGLAGGAVFGLASSTAKLGDDAAKTADKLGIGIAELQELRYAAERSGVSTGSFDTALEKMTKNIGLAMEGTGAQKDALDALGLSAADLAEMLPEEALGLIADRMNEVGTQAEKAAVANDIFGRSGIGMLNMLRGGSRGLRDLRDDARRTGYVLSEQAARDAEVFQDTLLDTQLVMKGLKNTVGAELMPVVTGAMKRIGDALVENRDEVKVWSEAFATRVEAAIPVIGKVATGIGKVSTKVGEVITGTADMVGGWENFGTIIGGLMLAKTAISVGKFATAAFSLGRATLVLTPLLPLIAGGFRAVGIALTANPIGALITAIGVGAALIYENWDKVKPVLQPVLDWMGEKFTWLWDNAGKPLIEGLKTGVDGIASAWETVKTALGAVLDWLGEKFTWLLGKIKPAIDAMKWVAGNKDSVFEGMSQAELDAASGKPTVGETLGSRQPGSSATPDLIGIAAGNTGQPAVKPQANALGGVFGRGWHLTGEKGPELKFENRAGYVADNRAMRQLASYADRAAGLVSGSGVPAVRGDGGGGAKSVVININAAGASAAEVIAMIERRTRTLVSGGLFDRVPATGPYGR